MPAVEAKTIRNKIGSGLPKFGPYLEKRLKLRAEEAMKNKNKYTLSYSKKLHQTELTFVQSP